MINLWVLKELFFSGQNFHLSDDEFKQFQIHLAFRYKNKNSFIDKHVDSQVLTIIHSNIVNAQ